MRQSTRDALRRAEQQERRRETLRSNDGFRDMVVREAEAMILHADVDALVEFAYGSWAEAEAAWGERQRKRFRPGKAA